MYVTIVSSTVALEPGASMPTFSTRNIRFNRVAIAWLMWLVVLIAGSGAAGKVDAAQVQLPSVLATVKPDWMARGSGTLRWFGLEIYRATLWAPPSVEAQSDQPFALAIRYSRALSGERLVRTSLDEMRRLGTADEATLQNWEQLLRQAFPDVEAGDVIVGVNIPSVGVEFHHGDRPSGVIRDQAFADAFFSIWFDERTREPGLRAQLIGGRDG